jgi:hypothetical protein
VRALAWFALIALPALSVAAEGTVKVRAFAKYGAREAQALRTALGARATAR